VQDGLGYEWSQGVPLDQLLQLSDTGPTGSIHGSRLDLGRPRQLLCDSSLDQEQALRFCVGSVPTVDGLARQV
jgi:hypothetical protein